MNPEYDELVKTVRYQVCSYRQAVEVQRENLDDMLAHGLPKLTYRFMDRLRRLEQTEYAMSALNELAELAGLTIDCTDFDPAED